MFLDDPGIYFEVHGQGRPLVLLNGIMMNTLSWEEHVKRLSAHHRVIVYDMRDQGQSARMAPGYDIGVHAGDLKKLLAHLSVETADLLGVSYGGQVALIFSLAYPEMVDRLVLANTTDHVDRYLLSLGQLWKRAAALYDGEAFFDLALPPIYSRTFTNEHHEWLAARREVFKNFLTREWFDGLIRLASANETYDVRGGLPNIAAETLLIAAENDMITPYGHMLAMDRRLPRSRIACIPDTGHAAFLEKLDTFCLLVRGFLES